jgi:ubiquinone/menaquinone biosynthesis C-methylase UbiE
MNVHAALSSLVSELDESASRTDSLYTTLAPVYEFMFVSNSGSDQHFTDQLRLTKKAVASDTRSVLEVGCGTGRLLPILAQEYETVVGVDLHEEMASLARERTTHAAVFQADMRTVSLSQSFDAVVLFEFMASLLKRENDVHTLFDNCYEHLHPNGILLCEVVNEPTVVLPSSTQVFTDDLFRVERTVAREEWLTSEVFMTKSSYRIYEKQTDREISMVERTPIRLFTPTRLRTMLTQAGFVSIDISDAADGIAGRARRPSSAK